MKKKREKKTQANKNNKSLKNKCSTFTHYNPIPSSTLKLTFNKSMLKCTLDQVVKN